MMTIDINAQMDFWSMTAAGGTNGYGTIFKYNDMTNEYTFVHNFDSINGSYPFGSLLLSSNGKLYGMTKNGGTYNKGTLFSINPATNVYNLIFSFTGGQGGGVPEGTLIESANGRLYGMTLNEDTTLNGMLFMYDTTTNAPVICHVFSDTIHGYLPYGKVIQATDSRLYGMTSAGGAHGKGVLFRYDTALHVYKDMIDFNGMNGQNPYGSLYQQNNKLYGMTKLGGAYGKGNIFYYNLADSSVTNIYSFDSINGAYPYGDLINYIWESLVGMTSAGGTYNDGVAFNIDTLGNMENVSSFQNIVLGSHPLGSFVHSGFSFAVCYAMTNTGGANEEGVIVWYSGFEVLNLRSLNDSIMDGISPQFSNFIAVPDISTGRSIINSSGMNCTIYPNPANTILNIHFAQLGITNYELRMF